MQKTEIEYQNEGKKVIGILQFLLEKNTRYLRKLISNNLILEAGPYYVENTILNEDLANSKSLNYEANQKEMSEFLKERKQKINEI